MTEEDARTATVSRAKALAEIRKHTADVSEFLSEVGDRIEYSGSEVLDWLGY